MNVFVCVFRLSIHFFCPFFFNIFYTNYIILKNNKKFSKIQKKKSVLQQISVPDL